MVGSNAQLSTWFRLQGSHCGWMVSGNKLMFILFINEAFRTPDVQLQRSFGH